MAYYLKEILEKTKPYLKSTHRYNGRIYLYKKKWRYKVIEALYPNFDCPNNLEAILLLQSRLFSWKMAYLYKDGTLDWKTA